MTDGIVDVEAVRTAMRRGQLDLAWAELSRGPVETGEAHTLATRFPRTLAQRLANADGTEIGPLLRLAVAHRRARGPDRTLDAAREAAAIRLLREGEVPADAALEALRPLTRSAAPSPALLLALIEAFDAVRLDHEGREDIVSLARQLRETGYSGVETPVLEKLAALTERAIAGD